MPKINIAKDFSVYPGGRYISDGDHSGELFRETLLVPPLNQGETIEIELDGTRGYGSSFLEETFGGLVRLGYPKELINEKIKLITVRKSLKEEILDYIDKAEQE